MTKRVSKSESLESAGLRKIIATWWLAIVALLVIGIMLHPDAKPPFGMDDWLAHGLLYYAVAMMFLLSRPASLGISIGLVLGLATSTEALQVLTPNRHADPTDLVANFTGIGMALVSWWLALLLSNARSRRGIAK